MSQISKCSMKDCGYNVNENCHAKAITVGDYSNPGCDTYFANQFHVKETQLSAGVGACKVETCQFNKDFECTSESISVGMKKGKVNCLTFIPNA